MMLKVSSSSISPGNLKAKPGPGNGCYYVLITDVPNGVSVGQVILLFTHTVTSHIEIAFFLTVIGVDCGAPKGAVLTLIGALENLSRNSLARVV